MTSEIEVKVLKGVKVNVVEVEEIEDGAAASITSEDDKKLKVHVKRLHGKPGVSSKVVDVIMCG